MNADPSNPSNSSDSVASHSFTWHPSESFDALLKEMQEAEGLPHRRLERHEHHTIVKADGYEGEPINDLRLCPVNCPP